MTKGDAAGALAGLLALALFVAWFLTMLYARDGTKLRKFINAVSEIFVAAMALGLVGFIVYCIYVLIA